MSDLVATIRSIQREVGVKDDGVFGPISAGAVLRELRREVCQEEETHGGTPALRPLDARTAATLATLDPKAQPAFERFALLAKATAATLGCDYVAISGHRTWEEQDELYAQGRTKPGKKVTNASGGRSKHNFGIAADFGVFQGRIYCDEMKPSLAAQVHRACAAHAAGCGLEWGGDWRTLKDYPHYEVSTGLSLAEMRALYVKGSVLA